MRSSLRLLALATSLLLLAGCTTSDVRRDPRVRLEQRRHFFVESELADGHGIDKMIAAELIAMGYRASSGPLTMLPPEADTVVSYETRWTWDFKTYLIMLNVQVRDAETGRPIGAAYFHRPGIRSMETRTLVREVLDKLLPGKPAPAPLKPAQP